MAPLQSSEGMTTLLATAPQTPPSSPPLPTTDNTGPQTCSCPLPPSVKYVSEKSSGENLSLCLCVSVLLSLCLCLCVSICPPPPNSSPLAQRICATRAYGEDSWVKLCTSITLKEIAGVRTMPRLKKDKYVDSNEICSEPPPQQNGINDCRCLAFTF